MGSRLGELFSEESDIASVFVEHIRASDQYKSASRARLTCQRMRTAITRENCYEIAERRYEDDHERLGGELVARNCIHGLHWLRRKQPSRQLSSMGTLTAMAVRHGRSTLLDSLIKAPFRAPVDEFTVAEAVTQGDGSTLMFLHSRFPNSVIRKSVVTDAAVRKGDCDILDFLDANGYPHASPFNGFEGLESERAKELGHAHASEWLAKRHR